MTHNVIAACFDQEFKRNAAELMAMKGPEHVIKYLLEGGVHKDFVLGLCRNLVRELKRKNKMGWAYDGYLRAKK